MNATNAKTKWWLMLISIALGGVSAWAIDQHLQEKTVEIESRNHLEQLTLMVASRDLTRNAVIEESDYVAELFPVKWAPDDAITLDQSENLIGKKLLTDVRAGQPLMHIHLQELDVVGISTRLTPELKAVSVTIDPSSAAAGLIRTGDRVDLFISLDHLGKRITVGLLRAVEVLGTGNLFEMRSRTDGSAVSPEANITLAVSHDDAVKLVAAREAGSISAVLSSVQDVSRNNMDKGSTADLATLLGLPNAPASRVIPIMYGDRLISETEDMLQDDRLLKADASHQTASVR